LVESEDEGDTGDAEADDVRAKKASPPPAKKAKRDREEEIDECETHIYTYIVIG
jgi:hypothetical protein